MPVPSVPVLSFLSHKGHRGLVVFDAVGERYCGRLLYVADDVRFEGPTARAAAERFRSLVNARIQARGAEGTPRFRSLPAA